MEQIKHRFTEKMSKNIGGGKGRGMELRIATHVL